MELVDDHYCFACGSENKLGLCVDWKIEGETTTTEFIAPRHFQGWKGVVHGGIVATLLDEAITRLAWVTHGGALTAEITVRYLKPAPIGKKLFVKGEIKEVKGRIILAESEVKDENGILIAQAKGKAIKPKK